MDRRTNYVHYERWHFFFALVLLILSIQSSCTHLYNRWLRERGGERQNMLHDDDGGDGDGATTYS